MESSPTVAYTMGWRLRAHMVRGLVMENHNEEKWGGIFLLSLLAGFLHIHHRRVG